MGISDFDAVRRRLEQEAEQNQSTTANSGVSSVGELIEDTLELAADVLTGVGNCACEVASGTGEVIGAVLGGIGDCLGGIGDIF